MAAAGETAEEMLGRVKLRRTGGRVAILRVLAGAGEPMTQEGIAGELGRSLDKVTIYRALESFVGAGLVHEVDLAGRVSHYELAHRCSRVQCHPHFTCSGCGVTRCLPGVEVPLAEVPAGFVIERQQVRLEGVCDECRGTAGVGE